VQSIETTMSVERSEQLACALELADESIQARECTVGG
jgi:hypothetical protein